MLFSLDLPANCTSIHDLHPPLPGNVNLDVSFEVSMKFPFLMFPLFPKRLLPYLCTQRRLEE